MGRALAVAWALAVTLSAPAAWADDFRCPTDTPDGARADEARALFEEALRLEAGDPEEALVRLRCADELVERPAVALRIGIISERLGQHPTAAAAYRSYLERAGDAAPDRAEIEERIAELESAHATPPPVEAPAPPPEDPRPRAAGLVVTGAGGVTAIVGVALLIAAKAHNDQVHGLAPGTAEWDSDEAKGTLDQALVEQGVGIAMLVAGGALVGAGLTIAYWPPGEETEAGGELVVRPTGATLRLRF